nr:hypothetical protein [Pedobacter panaciterrae]
MGLTKPATFTMATICLNLSYCQLKEELSEESYLQLYQYGFSEFKSGYTPALRIKKNNRGQTLTVLNYTVEQLFATAYGEGLSINHDQTIIDVKERIKLQGIRCYKLFVPQQQAANFYCIMQQNLKLEFPDYQVTIELVENEKYMIITDIV